MTPAHSGASLQGNAEPRTASTRALISVEAAQRKKILGLGGSVHGPWQCDSVRPKISKSVAQTWRTFCRKLLFIDLNPLGLFNSYFRFYKRQLVCEDQNTQTAFCPPTGLSQSCVLRKAIRMDFRTLDYHQLSHWFVCFCECQKRRDGIILSFFHSCFFPYILSFFLFDNASEGWRGESWEPLLWNWLSPFACAADWPDRLPDSALNSWHDIKELYLLVHIPHSALGPVFSPVFYSWLVQRWFCKGFFFTLRMA